MGHDCISLSQQWVDVLWPRLAGGGGMHEKRSEEVTERLVPKSARIVYVTRHFNRCGYAVLRGLIDYNLTPVAVVLRREVSLWMLPGIRHAMRRMYLLLCKYYRCSPLKAMKSEAILAKKNGIPILFVESINSHSSLERISQFSPDLIVMGGGWHERLLSSIRAVPQLGSINTHPSLLPEFRGTSITRWQVLHGIRTSGVTVHSVESSFDTGAIFAQEHIDVTGLNPQEMFERLGGVAETLVPKVALAILSGTAKRPAPQNMSVGEYFGRWEWKKEKLRIDWNAPFQQIHHFVLANTQELFRYRGPEFCFGGREFILRKTSISCVTSAEIGAPVAGGAIRLSAQNDGSVALYRKGDPHSLRLVSVQEGGRLFALRRARAASDALSLVGSIDVSVEDLHK